MPQEPNFPFAVCKSLPFTNKPPSSTCKRAQPKREWPVTDPVKLEPGPDEAALLALYLKFYFTPSSNDPVPRVLLFTPCKETEQTLLIQGVTGEAKRPNGQRKSEEIWHIWPGTQTAAVKSAGETSCFLWDTETLLSLQIFPSARVVCRSGKCHFLLTTRDVLQTTQIAVGDYMYVCIHIFNRNIIMLKKKKKACSRFLTP